MVSIDAQTVSTFILALMLTVTTLGTRFSAKGRKSTRERNQLRQLVEDCIEYIHTTAVLLADKGIPRPPLPKSLRDYLKGDDEE